MSTTDPTEPRDGAGQAVRVLTEAADLLKSVEQRAVELLGSNRSDLEVAAAAVAFLSSLQAVRDSLGQLRERVDKTSSS